MGKILRKFKKGIEKTWSIKYNVFSENRKDLITMFENIITEKEIEFNNLEKKIYKFVCMLGCLIIKIILEKQDNWC